MKSYLYLLRNYYAWEIPGLRPVFENTLYNLKNRGQELYDPFQNKVAVVTGASSGIGRAISLEMASRGVKVMLASRKEENLQALKNEIEEMGGIASVFATDVTDEKSCQELMKTTIGLYRKIDILINNAGISMYADFSEVDLGVLRTVMETNFWGAVYCCRYALPHVIQSRGSIVGISSICGVTPLPGRSGYSASKHALDGFLESLRLENQGNGLHIMLVHPGYTTSNIRREALDKNGNPKLDSTLDEDKLMSAEKVAKEVLTGISLKKRDIVLTREGKIITWIYKRRPHVAERLLHREKLLK